MREFVWVDSWQQECCGEPFAVESSVSWQARPADRSWIRKVIGDEWADRIHFSEEHHSGDEQVPIGLHGVVRSIRAITHELRPMPDRPSGGLEAAPGTGVIHDVDEADPWEFEPRLPSAEPRVKPRSWSWRRRAPQTSVRIVAQEPNDSRPNLAGWIVELDLEADAEPSGDPQVTSDQGEPAATTRI